MNRSNPGAPQQQHNPAAQTSAQHPAAKKKSKFSGGDGDSKSIRIASIVLLFSVTILIVFLVFSFVLGPKNESSYVEKDRLQAVFLNGGQVYFGKISDLNDKYIRMSDIFYLRVNQVVQPNQEGTQQASGDNISLVKLGCELHRPSNEMLINRSQVVFWENLKDESGENTVPGAVANYKTQYPNGQECQAGGGTTDTGATQTTPTTGTGTGSGTGVTGTGTN